MAEKYYNDARERLNEKADEILGKQDKIKNQLKTAYDGELNDLSKGWAKLSDSNEDSKIEQKEIRSLAKEEMKARKENKELEHWDNETLHDLVIAKKRGNAFTKESDGYKKLQDKYGKDFIDKKYNDLDQNYEIDPNAYVHDDGYAETVLRPKQNNKVDKQQALDQLKKTFDKFNDVDFENFYGGPGAKQQDELVKEIGEIVQNNNLSREDWEKVYKPPFSYGIDLDYDDYAKKPQSTNETMNDAIREKASKKTQGLSYIDSKRKAQERKYSADEEDILDRYGEDYGYPKGNNLKNLKGQIDYMRIPNESIHKTAERLVEGGDFLIYNEDIKNWLKERNIKFNDDNFFDKYKKVMADDIEGLYNKANNQSFSDSIRKQATMKDAYKQYMKDHPESKMSLSEFKKMNK